MRVVAHDLRLGELGQAQRRRPAVLPRDEVVVRFVAHVMSVPSRTRELEEERLEGLHLAGADVGDGLPPDRAQRAATAWREPVISATASTSASASLSLVSSVHCTITSSRPRRSPST